MKILGASLLSTGAFLLLSSGMAFAAANTLTGTALVLTVGTATQMNTLTVTDTDGATITAANDLLIKIPAGVDAVFDSTDTTATIVDGGTCVTSTTVTFPEGGAAPKIVKLNITSNCAAGNTIQVSGLTLVGGSTSSATAYQFANDNADYTAATFGNGSATIGVTATTSLTATVTIGSNQVGGSGSSNLTVYLPTVLTTGDTIKLTFPANYYIAALNGIATEGTIANMSVTGQVLTITATGTITYGSTVFTFPGTQNIAASYAASGTSSILIERAAGADIAAASNNTAITGFTTTASTAATTLTVTTVNNSAIASPGDLSGTFTLTGITFPNQLSAGDTVKIAFPVNYDVSTLTTGAGKSYGLDNTVAVGVSSQIVTLTLEGSQASGAETLSFQADKVLATYASSAPSITVLIEKSGGEDVVAASANTGVSKTMNTAVTTGDLTSTNVEPQTLSTGVESKNTITFVTTATIPNLGKIAVTYPSGWSVSGANSRTATDLSGLDGTWTASVSGQVVTFTQTSGTASTAGTKVLALANGIMAPSGAGSGGTYTITTTIAAGSEIETDAAVSTDTIAQGSSSSDSSSSTQTTTTTTTTTPTTTTTTTDATTTTTTTDTSTDTSTDIPADSAPVDTVVKTTGGETVTLSDIDKSWAKTEIEAMTTKGIVKGNKDGTFKPEDALNKADAAVLICRIMKVDEMKAVDADPATDVKKDSYFGSCVSQLKSAKVVTGNPDGTYTPGKDANRAEFIALALRAYGTMLKDQAKTDFDASMTAAEPKASFKDVDTKKDWYANVAATAKDKEFVNGRTCGADKCFDGAKSITRAEATTVLFRIFKDLI